MTRAPVIALSHGGGPMPLLGDEDHVEIVKSLRTRVPDILRLHTPEARPRAIVLVTAHWSEQNPTISSAQKHHLFYDYSGFPPESYELRYDAPGSPDVANEVARAMEQEGLDPKFDANRGWDHGLFIPLLLINPEADVPIVQVSVLSSESTTAHLAMGRALLRLRDSNVAIIGSGFATFHNFHAMSSGASSRPDFRSRNDEWSRAVSGAVQEPDATMRQQKLENWRSFPNAYEMHPFQRAEHFLPLIVAAGAGGNAAAKSYTDAFRGLDMFSYYWD